MRCRSLAFGCASLLACIQAATAAPAGGGGGASLDRATTNYLTHCGGCHGIEGRAPHTFVPPLRDEVGRFLCSAEGRAYLGRVPGVSMSLIRDDQQLADVMNFVIFRLGGDSTPAATPPYTAAEIHMLRRMPMQSIDLVRDRADILQRALAQCAAR